VVDLEMAKGLNGLSFIAMRTIGQPWKRNHGGAVSAI